MEGQLSLNRHSATQHLSTIIEKLGLVCFENDEERSPSRGRVWVEKLITEEHVVQVKEHRRANKHGKSPSPAPSGNGRGKGIGQERKA